MVSKHFLGSESELQTNKLPMNIAESGMQMRQRLDENNEVTISKV